MTGDAEPRRVVGAKVTKILGVDVSSLAPDASRELTERLLADTGSIQARLLGLYQRLAAETDIRDWCAAHDAAGELWDEIDELERELYGG